MSEDIKIQQIADIIYPGQDANGVKTNKGKFEFWYSNDYPMQHGSGEKVLITARIFELLSELTAERLKNEKLRGTLSTLRKVFQIMGTTEALKLIDEALKETEVK